MSTQSTASLAVSVQGEGVPILCLHGHPGSSASLSVFTSTLSQHYLTIAPDLRGYGRSQTQSFFEMSDHLRDLDVLWDQYHLNDCIILGWSLGGILAMELALRHPGKVKGLILVATAARPRSKHPPVSWRDNLYTAIAGLTNAVCPAWKWNIKTFGQRSLFRYLIRRHTAVAYQYLAQEALPAYLKTSKWANQALNNALRTGYDRLDKLDSIRCPCLVLAGECDLHITPQASQETAQHLCNSQWICYPETAHLFPWEIPEKVQHDINVWLQQHPELSFKEQ
ncbi:Tropinesterase [Acaryochloris thomasi RCC1774]|uniref:Tropinesterase n=1 Tax=Acaryochloris thomasi RCC1774 TaxID=1764569 RepID=A0A2W1JR80_9CYAN|nr:alpha/beta hydrolase [Acaryochloris thomasi]PZD71377.1 Tropinesterase [Acaryochloris thomasi RCC1774]